MTTSIRGMAPLLSVFDMPTSVRFYRDVLGFEVVSTSRVLGTDHFGWALLRLADVELMLNTAYDEGERPDARDDSRVDAHHDTCLYFGCPDVDAMYDKLRRNGLDCAAPEIAPYGWKQLYVHDPDGYNLCFQWPVTDDARARRASLDQH